jgi:hypothetical protein
MFAFGEKVESYDGLMFNEREVRAAAGIVFLFAFMAFMSGFLTGNNEPTKLMVSVFLFDFLSESLSIQSMRLRWLLAVGWSTIKSLNIQTLHLKNGLGHLALFWQ